VEGPDDRRRHEAGGRRSRRIKALRARRYRGDDGAAAVEFALLLPLFLLLVFGLISAGLAYYHKIGLAQDVREAGRFGATYLDGATGHNADQDPNGFVAAVADTLIRDASQQGDLHYTGAEPSTTLDTTDTHQMVCVAYIQPDGTATREVRGNSALVPAGAPSNNCYNDGLGANAGYPRVQVYAQGDSTWNLMVFPGGPTVTYTSSAVYRYERSWLTS
jgi:TadE-like protein